VRRGGAWFEKIAHDALAPVGQAMIPRPWEVQINKWHRLGILDPVTEEGS